LEERTVASLGVACVACGGILSVLREYGERALFSRVECSWHHGVDQKAILEGCSSTTACRRVGKGRTRGA
jgi:hypothetical protein